jgi:hypothetical protein
MSVGLEVTNTKPGNLSQSQILPDSNKLGVVTNYAVHFTLVNGLLDTAASFEIYFPPKYYPKF